MELKKKKKEVILIVAIIILSCILLLVNHFLFSKPARQVTISVDGEIIATKDLDQDADFVVEGYNHGTNRIIIKNGGVHVSEASCPDKICIHQGTIKHTGESIVCLPNRLIATIIGD